MRFYRETEFQETEIGKIPKDWKVIKLGTLCRFKRGFSYRSSQITSNQTQIRFLTINDIEKEGGLKRDSEKLYIREDVEIDPEFFVNEGDVLIANTDMSKGFIIGAPILIKNIVEKYVYSMDLTKIIFNKDTVDSVFLFYYLKHPSMRRRMKSAAQGTNVLHLNHAIVREFFVPLPPFQEQQKIAEILSTVDRAIEDVDETIARLERLKKALMGELLAGRIRVKEVDGKLTFYRETEFQETEIGKIPKDWKVTKLGEIAKIIMGQSPPSETYNKDGVGMPFLQGKMEFGRIYPSPSMYTTKPIKIAEPNDILISVRAPVGDVNITPYRLCIGRGLAAIRLNPALAFNLFYFYYLQWSKNRLENLGKGSTFRAITLEDLKEFKVTCPPYNEQQKLAEVLSTVDKTIELYQYERSKLEKVKNGLMSVLLTGKVRARDD